MSEDIAPYNATMKSQRVIDEFPISGKLESYDYFDIEGCYRLRISSIGISPTQTYSVFFRNSTNFTKILEIMNRNFSTTISQQGDHTDSVLQPDGSYQSLPKIIRIASGVSSFQTDGLERVILKKSL